MKILMVCMGNICRSPLAEGILKEMALKNGLNWEIDSAGTIDWHQGEHPDPRSEKTALRHGIDISNQHSRPIQPGDLKDFDLVFAMDKKNLKDILELRGAKQFENKISLIMEEIPNSEILEVPDPYYDGEEGFENVYRLLTKACKAIIENRKK